jgi:phage gp36-like protein
VSYSTLQLLKDRYSERMLVEISDRGEAPTGQVDAALIGRAISDADALIDGYLAVRYRLPLAAVPRLVTDLSLRIAIYYAHAHVAEDKIRKDYEEALKTLRDIAAGLVKLDADGVEPAGSGGGEVLFNDPHRPLSADTMKGWI